MPEPHLDPGVVAGWIHELGADARARDHEHGRQRDAATWRAVVLAVQHAADGREPPARRTDPPPWLAPLVRARLATMAAHWPGGAFDEIRTLERIGLVELDADDTYVLAAVSGIGDRSAHSRSAALRGDPALIDEVVWKMFEVEGGGEVSLANVDKFTADDAGWQATFLELTADGTLPRERVRTSALRALTRDFSAYRAGWYSRLYVALSPTVDELTRDQPLLRALLRSSVTATVSLALRMLRTLSTQGALDDLATLPALQPAVVAGPKTAAMTAIRIVAEIADRHPDSIGEACDVAALALHHPHADVQTAAGSLLRALGAADRLEAAAALLEPSVRVDLLGHPPAPAEADREAPIGRPRVDGAGACGAGSCSHGRAARSPGGPARRRERRARGRIGARSARDPRRPRAPPLSHPARRRDPAPRSPRGGDAAVAARPAGAVGAPRRRSRAAAAADLEPRAGWLPGPASRPRRGGPARAARAAAPRRHTGRHGGMDLRVDPRRAPRPAGRSTRDLRPRRGAAAGAP